MYIIEYLKNLIDNTEFESIGIQIHLTKYVVIQLHKEDFLEMKLGTDETFDRVKHLQRMYHILYNYH